MTIQLLIGEELSKRNEMAVAGGEKSVSPTDIRSSNVGIPDMSDSVKLSTVD